MSAGRGDRGSLSLHEEPLPPAAQGALNALLSSGITGWAAGEQHLEGLR